LGEGAKAKWRAKIVVLSGISILPSGLLSPEKATSVHLPEPDQKGVFFRKNPEQNSVNGY
jgi:hypothetical protein